VEVNALSAIPELEYSETSWADLDMEPGSAGRLVHGSWPFEEVECEVRSPRSDTWDDDEFDQKGLWPPPPRVARS